MVRQLPDLRWAAQRFLPPALGRVGDICRGSFQRAGSGGSSKSWRSFTHPSHLLAHHKMSNQDGRVKMNPTQSPSSSRQTLRRSFHHIMHHVIEADIGLEAIARNSTAFVCGGWSWRPSDSWISFSPDRWERTFIRRWQRLVGLHFAQGATVSSHPSRYSILHAWTKWHQGELLLCSIALKVVVPG